MAKTLLTAQNAKGEFIKSIHKFLLRNLAANGNEKYSSCFVIEGSSIMCHLPKEFFNQFDIPDNLTIEMKFVAKKS